MKARVIINRHGGTVLAGKAEDPAAAIVEAFAPLDMDADVQAVEPGDLEAAFAAAAEDRSIDVIVAGGGDGTISAAAGKLAGTGRTLGVLPLGTLNHLARDAGIPGDLAGAAAVIAAGHVQAVDVGEVNGRVFINNSSVGLYPHMVRGREDQQGRLNRSKRLAMLFAGLRTLRHFKRHRLTVRVEGRAAPIETTLLFIGNNRYEISLFRLGHRAALDGGELFLYATLAPSRARLIASSVGALFGRVRQEDFISLSEITEVEISARTPALHVAADGETCLMDSPLRYRIRPKALNLIVPAPAEAAAAPTAPPA